MLIKVLHLPHPSVASPPLRATTPRRPPLTAHHVAHRALDGLILDSPLPAPTRNP